MHHFWCQTKFHPLLLLSSYIISLVCPVVVVLSIHPSRHPSSSSWKKKMMEEEEEEDEWLLLCTIYFHCSYLYNYYNYLETFCMPSLQFFTAQLSCVGAVENCN